MTTQQIIEAINALGPFPQGDLDWEPEEQIENLIKDLEGKEDAFETVEPFLRVFERSPITDFGAPGWIIHFIEDFEERYYPFLFESLRRQPSLCTIRMLNRIINGEKDKKQKTEYIKILIDLSKHPNSNRLLSQEIDEYIEYQEKQKRKK